MCSGSLPWVSKCQKRFIATNILEIMQIRIDLNRIEVPERYFTRTQSIPEQYLCESNAACDQRRREQHVGLEEEKWGSVVCWPAALELQIGLLSGVVTHRYLIRSYSAQKQTEKDLLLIPLSTIEQMVGSLCSSLSPCLILRKVEDWQVELLYLCMCVRACQTLFLYHFSP